MPPRRPNVPLEYRLRPLAACLAIAFCAEIAAAHGADDRAIEPTLSLAVPRHVSAQSEVGLALKSAFGKSIRTAPHDPSTTRTVKNCNDSGQNSLREVIGAASDGDVIEFDLSQSQCSTITLTSGEIAVNLDNLTLQGDAAAPGAITISGGGAFRVFEHVGSGTLAIGALTISKGYVHVSGVARGGCLSSTGSVFLSGTTITDCTALSDAAESEGGGIYAGHGVTLIVSTVSGNNAIAPGERGLGGGIYAAAIGALYSSISGNEAHDGTLGGLGGGAKVTGGMSIVASTIDHNAAAYASGLSLHDSSYIINSTISDNVARKFSALYARGNGSLAISNSTIAFNHANAHTLYAAVFFYGSALTLQSSIIASNTAGADDSPSDLSVAPGHGALSGADNLVTSTNFSPAGVITVTSDPMLGPLKFNGGGTLTRALLPGSPALGKGNNDALPTQTNDERGAGYPRTTGTGANATTDIGAVQFDTIFSDGFE